MKNSTRLTRWLFLPLLLLAISYSSKANGSNNTMLDPHGFDFLPNQLAEWRHHYKETVQMEPGFSYHTIAALVLSFLAAFLSSAGGTGGGPLFIPILNVVAGQDMKTAASYSAFMVAGCLLANVLCNFFPRENATEGPLIDYDIALLSQPFMLLGVSLGVMCNIMFPEWLITLLFVVVVAYSTYRTSSSGIKLWNRESALQNGGNVEGESGINQSLLHVRQSTERRSPSMPFKDIATLVLVWIFFFLLHLFIGDKHGKGMFNVIPCGFSYWLINSLQIPFAIVLTLYILNIKRNTLVDYSKQTDDEENAADTWIKCSPLLVFPIMALAVGILGGLFGVGGGLLLSPSLLMIGLPPQIASATSTFTLVFSAFMTMVQYIILGMKQIDQAVIYAIVCFVASALGLVITKMIVKKLRRESLIIFAVSTVLIVSTVTMTITGVIDVWHEYTSGEQMGFSPPC